MQRNAIIEANNIINKKQLDKCVLDKQLYKDQAIKLFSDILASMTEESQKLCKEYFIEEEFDND
jgi:hypothetical protein